MVMLCIGLAEAESIPKKPHVEATVAEHEPRKNR
jgi:hypothetical protein